MLRIFLAFLLCLPVSGLWAAESTSWKMCDIAPGEGFRPDILGFCRISPDGRRLMRFQSDQTLTVYDMPSGKTIVSTKLRRWEQGMEPWELVGCSYDKKDILYRNAKGSIAFWEASSGKRRCEWHREGCLIRAISPARPECVCVKLGTFAIFDFATNKIVKEIQMPDGMKLGRMDISANGRFACEMATDRVLVLDLEEGLEVYSIKIDKMLASATTSRVLDDGSVVIAHHPSLQFICDNPEIRVTHVTSWGKVKRTSYKLKDKWSSELLVDERGIVYAIRWHEDEKRIRWKLHNLEKSKDVLTLADALKSEGEFNATRTEMDPQGRTIAFEVWAHGRPFASKYAIWSQIPR